MTKSRVFNGGSCRYAAGLWCGWGHKASGAVGCPLSILRDGAAHTPSPRKVRGEGEAEVVPRYPAPIARRASASPISTKAEVTSGPPTRIRVGVFILFHS